MSALKGVIFGIRDVLVQEGQVEFDDEVLADIGRLVAFLRDRGIESVAIGNHDWTATDRETGKAQSLQECLREKWGVEFKWFVYGQGGFPPKQSAEALQFIRDKMGWQPNETLYVGNSDSDMRSAVNGGTLFLNALWFTETNEYGFRFSSPKEVARFIDVFCLRRHFWYFAIEENGIRVYCLAPYSTYAVKAYKRYSESLIATVKRKLGDKEDVHFWAQYLCTSMYFSGLYRDIDYITPYPGHEAGSPGPHELQEPMSAFAKCFRKNFIPDLVVRHTTATESKTHRDSVDHVNQLNTIHLSEHPRKKTGATYKNSPLRAGKTVCVLDDLLTNGFSFEAARAFIRQTGADVVCVAFLKTMKRDYMQIPIPKMKRGPYVAARFKPPVPELATYSYYGHIVDSAAAGELKERLELYRDWEWPDED